MKVKEKGIWTTEATAVFECQGWRTVLETAEKKRDEKFLRRIRGFDYLHVKHVSRPVSYTHLTLPTTVPV